MPETNKSTTKAFIVLSGKGGVGKSTVACEFAKQLSMISSTILLDIDLNGPTASKMIDIKNSQESFQQKKLSSENLKPLKVTENLSILSIGSLISSDQAIILRGPAKSRTSDEHISIVEELNSTNLMVKALLVTTPQQISVQDVQKEVNFCEISNLEIVGIIENMSYFECPCCKLKNEIFSSGGGKALAERYGLNFLGSLPFKIKDEKASIDKYFEIFTEVFNKILL